jgi:two-component system, OmpR family, phosphate regulon response regulator PhoB
MDKPTILIVEDEGSIRTLVRHTLEMADYEVNEAEDAKQALTIISMKHPELIILDWMLPYYSGIEFTKRLKQNQSTQTIPIIMLTAKAQEENIILGLDSGADDYVVKPFSPKELLARIRAVLRRGSLTTTTSSLLKVRDLTVNTESQRVTIGDNPIKLGPLEYRLLCFFMTHRDRVYTRDELLSYVWGNDSYVDERTVDVHIRRLRQQLTIEEHSALIQTVHGSGYRFSEKIDD